MAGGVLGLSPVLVVLEWHSEGGHNGADMRQGGNLKLPDSFGNRLSLIHQPSYIQPWQFLRLLS